MPYICQNPDPFENQPLFDNGQCVKLVRACIKHLPPAGTWKEGIKVWGATDIPRGTAPFVEGRYPDNDSGQHAEIYLFQDAHAIHVVDQYKGLKLSQRRKIRFKGGVGKIMNDASRYSVIK